MLDDESFRLRELIPFIGAIITGGVGGCVASIQHARSRSETVAAFAVAYSMTGAFGGVMALAAVMIFYPTLVTGWSELLIVTGLSGLVTSFALAAGNVSMRFVLRKIGLEVTVNVARAKKHEQSD